MSYKSHFENLDVYKSARLLRIKVWSLTKSFPNEEKFRLTDQIIRSTRKCAANIAEGNGRFHWQENIQFCRIARGSLTETQDHINVAEECGYLSNSECTELKNEVQRLIRLLNGYLNYLERKRNEPK
jgi:four helix bundle protein